LLDILESIDRIQKYARRGRQTFEDEELIKTWAIHHLEIIGEAAGRVSDLRARHPQVPWAEMAAMRNVLVHDYFGIDVERVWRTLDRDLPAIRKQLDSILSGLDA
jgi:uncharacterized protein with HEPN domain